jgi:hypothetical protein
MGLWRTHFGVFFIGIRQFFDAAANEQHAQKIETKIDESDNIGKLGNGLDLWHDLGNSEKYPDSCQKKGNPPDKLQGDFVFCHNHPKCAELLKSQKWDGKARSSRSRRANPEKRGVQIVRRNDEG